MHLKFVNVNDAFYGLVDMFRSRGSNDDSLNDMSRTPPFDRKPYKNPNGTGYRLQIMEPVTITYTKPQQRVLFNNARDANPFFHLYEALWMLAGRNDVAPLKYYCSNIDFCSDDGKTFNGAYGRRWRKAANWHKNYDECFSTEALLNWNTVDQLKEIISLLRETSETSRAVLAMWNVEDDLMKVKTSKDVCCNLDVVFSIRDDEYDSGGIVSPEIKYLDITVFNRSNDLIWGALGANYVHFSMLQEYVAAHLGIEVGHYHQCTSNLHTYDYNFKPQEFLAEYDNTVSVDNYNWYSKPNRVLLPLVKEPERFDKELVSVVKKFTGCDSDYVGSQATFTEPFLQDVAQPMFTAFKCYKQKSTYSAMECASEIKSDDWRTAAENWLKRRIK